MKMQKIAIYILVLALAGVLAIGCNGAPDAGEVYEGAADGFGGAVKVNVTMDEGEIVDIEIVESSETDGFGDRAFDALIPQIIEAQGTAGIDVETGATASSDALFNAVEDALSKVE